MLTDKEIERYQRHIVLPEIGAAGQEKLKQAKVFVIGAGGLGSPLLLYLAAAGIGTIGIADDDTVDVTNLQRQVLYTTADIGLSKAQQAREKLLAQNPTITVIAIRERITRDNILDLIRDYDVIVDGTDNFATRYLVNDACVILKKPLVFGSIFKFEGQVSVLNYNNGPTYRCLYPDPPGEGEVPDCSQAGVLGVLPGIIGTLQANEVIKIVTGIGDVLSGKLLMFDALSMSFQTISFPAVAANKNITALGVYEDLSCSIMPVREVDHDTLLNGVPAYQRVDVRNRHEYEEFNIGGELIPLSELERNIQRIPRTQPVVFICQSGVRSKKAVELLQQKYGYDNVYSLRGGIMSVESADTEL